MLKKYRLSNGSIYWHKLYFAVMPDWMTNYGPIMGHMNYAAYLYQPHEYVIDLYNQAKWFIQRGSRGYADCDVWGLDSYLCSWMPQALTSLKNNNIGHPMGLTDEVWHDKLDRMINAFKIASKIQNLDYKTTKEMQVALKQFRKDFNLVKIHFFSLWD